MKLGVISDIHGNLPALEACWALLEEERVDRTVCLGDLVQFGPYPGEVVDFIMEKDIDTVQGNCDRAVGRGRSQTGDRFELGWWGDLARDFLSWTSDELGSERLRYLRKLPMELRFEDMGKSILCVHGLPGDITGELPGHESRGVADHLLESSRCDVLMAGHTHEMTLISRPGGLLLNPGSVGGGTLPGKATLMILGSDDEGSMSVSWHRVPWDTARYRKRYEKEGLPETFLKCVLLGRDPRGKWHTDLISWRQKWAEHS